MDAKDLRTESALGERSNDGSSKFAQSVSALPCNTNKPYENMSSNPLAKVETPTSRPCAVIGPDRIVPPPSAADTYLKKAHYEPWPPMDNTYRQPPEYPHKMPSYLSPLGNISPRQTFQENMPRIMVQPTYSTKVIEDASYAHERNLPKNVKLNGPSEPKYCDVPYNVNQINNDQKSSEMCVSNVNNPRNYPQVWHPAGVNMRPGRPYGVPELYQYPEYPSCAGPRPVPITRPHRTINEDPGHVYSDTYYHENNHRFKPYPNIKERYPQSRYEYVSNYANPFQAPHPFPPYKYDMQKPLPPHLSHSQVPIKYVDNRMPDHVLDGYQRPVQGPYPTPYRNQVIHPNFGPMPGTNLPNKIYPYPTESMVKPVAANKLPYDSKFYMDYDMTRNKGFPVSENFYDMRSHIKNPVVIPNYSTANMHPIHSHSYYRKENPSNKNFEYMSHSRHLDPTFNPNVLPKMSSQFSPSSIAISPSDSNTSNDTSHTQGGSQEDCGYVSQSSTASIRSVDSGFNTVMPNDFHRRYNYAYPTQVRMSPLTSKPEINTNPSKTKKNIDVRQFLQMWNEGDEENGSNTKEAMTQPDFNNTNKAAKQNQYEIAKNNEQLYVLGLTNVPSEELGKYEHIQKVSKLPENIKGYNNIELLKHFEEAIESSNLNQKHAISRNYHIPPKHSLLQALPPRPLSPLDVEAKISQSVIHKEVGCNFEIKPCSPEMLNVEVATPAQNILNERTIEKVTNPLVVKSPMLSSRNDMNENMCNVMKQSDHTLIINENNKNPSCKMINPQCLNNDATNVVKPNYSLQDLESNAGVCLASLPRLDNDIELNFPEVNQQFINANKESVIITTDSNSKTSHLGFNIDETVESIENPGKVLTTTDSEKEYSKLSKYRKIKKNDGVVMEQQFQINSQSIRTDSVIIKNPENTKTIEHFSENQPGNGKDELRKSIMDPDICAHDINEIKLQTNVPHEIAIDFSLNKMNENYIPAQLGTEKNKKPKTKKCKKIFSKKTVNEKNSTSKMELVTNTDEMHEPISNVDSTCSVVTIANFADHETLVKDLNNKETENSSNEITSNNLVAVGPLLTQHKEENKETSSLFHSENVEHASEHKTSMNSPYSIVQQDSEPHGMISSDVNDDTHVDTNSTKNIQQVTLNSLEISPDIISLKTKCTYYVDKTTNEDSKIKSQSHTEAFSLQKSLDILNNVQPEIDSCMETDHTTLCDAKKNNEQIVESPITANPVLDLMKACDTSKNENNFNSLTDVNTLTLVPNTNSDSPNTHDTVFTSCENLKATAQTRNFSSLMEIDCTSLEVDADLGETDNVKDNIQSKNSLAIKSNSFPKDISELSEHSINSNTESQNEHNTIINSDRTKLSAIVKDNSDIDLQSEKESILQSINVHETALSYNNLSKIVEDECYSMAAIDKNINPVVEVKCKSMESDTEPDDCQENYVSNSEPQSGPNVIVTELDDYSDKEELKNESSLSAEVKSPSSNISDISNENDSSNSVSQNRHDCISESLGVYDDTFQSVSRVSSSNEPNNSVDARSLTENDNCGKENINLKVGGQIVASSNIENIFFHNDDDHSFDSKPRSSLECLSDIGSDTITVDNNSMLPNIQKGCNSKNNVNNVTNIILPLKKTNNQNELWVDATTTSNNIDEKYIDNNQHHIHECVKKSIDLQNNSNPRNQIANTYKNNKDQQNLEKFNQIMNTADFLNNTTCCKDSGEICSVEEPTYDLPDIQRNGPKIFKLCKELYSPWIQKLYYESEREMTNALCIGRPNYESRFTSKTNDVIKKACDTSSDRSTNVFDRAELGDVPPDNPCNILADECISEMIEEHYDEDANLLNGNESFDLDIPDKKPDNKVEEIIVSDEPIAEDSGIYGEGSNSCCYANDDIILENESNVTLQVPYMDCDEDSIEKSLNEIHADSPLPRNQSSLDQNISSRCLKRSLSDSALDMYNNDSIEENVPKKKNKLSKNKALINVFNIPNNRRNSISSVYNEENLSFCIVIDDNCIITEENMENEKLCYNISEGCLQTIQDDSVNEDVIESSEDIILCPQNDSMQYVEPLVLQISDEKSFEETWVDDVACVETVVSDDIAEDIIISTPSTPRDMNDSDNDDLNMFHDTSAHTEKVKYIYGDNMCNDDAELVETLYRTPQMDVNRTLTNRESFSSDNYCENQENELEENKTVGSSEVNSVTNSIDEIISDVHDSQLLSTVMDPAEIASCISSNISHENAQDDIVHSCESSIDEVFSLNDDQNCITNSAFSSPEVSSTTTEEKNSAILLKITNYKGTRISHISDVNLNRNNTNSCRFTENVNYASYHSNSTEPRPLITKAAQKYIPPPKDIVLGDLKVKLPLPQHSLIKYKQLKISRNERLCNSVPKSNIQKKPKPKFEDVLKSIDEIQFKKHKEKSKKPKKSVPKVVIKKNENGSHYASTSINESFNPDLTGRKWQPWVFIEKDIFIDKMAIKKKSKAIFSYRKNTYVLADKFKKYKSIPSAKFVISQSQRELDDSSAGQFKYTIRLKPSY